MRVALIIQDGDVHPSVVPRAGIAAVEHSFEAMLRRTGVCSRELSARRWGRRNHRDRRRHSGVRRVGPRGQMVVAPGFRQGRSRNHTRLSEVTYPGRIAGDGAPRGRLAASTARAEVAAFGGVGASG